jgi:hypothetical protein
LEVIENANRRLDQYYSRARHPAYAIISWMETEIERDLKAREDQEALP